MTHKPLPVFSRGVRCTKCLPCSSGLKQVFHLVLCHTVLHQSYAPATEAPRKASLACGCNHSKDYCRSNLNQDQTKGHIPHKDWSGRATPCNRHEPVHRSVSKAGLAVSKLVEKRSNGWLQRRDDVIVSCLFASPDRHEGCIQEIEGAKENLWSLTGQESPSMFRCASPRQNKMSKA